VTALEAVHADAVHVAAMDAATAIDVRYAAEHPGVRCYVRARVDHEMCPNGGPCRQPPAVKVFFLTGGVMYRVARPAAELPA